MQAVLTEILQTMHKWLKSDSISSGDDVDLNGALRTMILHTLHHHQWLNPDSASSGDVNLNDAPFFGLCNDTQFDKQFKKIETILDTLLKNSACVAHRRIVCSFFFHGKKLQIHFQKNSCLEMPAFVKSNIPKQFQ